ncbi:hypothetical protein JYU34_011302 [Plutella xylostella]|uniref:Uncharacterized protein n=2 Tax=Plutella xylostella TaxID=51655 RepID=A0ABQ7QGK6_PLUXY|nr:hypothetical protein JYU34_011302 [Plutella xylostella]CAG9107550.1 unnamed protein product [Plutella xylostella]
MTSKVLFFTLLVVASIMMCSAQCGYESAALAPCYPAYPPVIINRGGGGGRSSRDSLYPFLFYILLANGGFGGNCGC